MADDTLIPVENAVLLLSGANDIMVAAEDKGSSLCIMSRDLSTWNKKTSVRIVREDGQRYVRKNAIIRALNKLGAFDREEI